MNKSEIIKNTLNTIFGHLHIKPQVEIEQKEETLHVYIEGDDLSFLIGYRGESLDALQIILAQIVYKQTGEWSYINVDINDYRKGKVEKIEDITKTFIDKVRFFGKEVEMPPMTSFERRQVHTFISSYDDVMSESTGERSERRVVLKPKKT